VSIDLEDRMAKKNRLGGEIDIPGWPPWKLDPLNQILECEEHGPYRAHQAPPLGYSTCPLCHQEAEDQYYRDGRRYSYWPGS